MWCQRRSVGVGRVPEAEGVAGKSVRGVRARVGDDPGVVGRVEPVGVVGGFLVELDGERHRVYSAGHIEADVAEGQDPTGAAAGGR